ncbi:hypothetical protein [Methylobacterium gregans]|uniref:Uncharacterized protein n=1 Tax=Methylobacterium gregans TaxID=374424 RepID=A0AA37MAW4_9HYPH|nr:hypothetical protein [Methylobacterium gregans]MDQ0523870.1 hypothetical protein [Methylobacterium gregans]GJD78164.1 hypothetical protein NBEOAGPD_1378 [Methylobacterium gregans]GLS54701.1 hypothetical protein GCM10007886_28840 [Methylobacterium gregans]
MKTRIAAAVAALALAAAPVSAMAYDAYGYGARYTGFVPYEAGFVGAPLGVHDTPFYAACPMDSAAEGNANQQTRPVKQYGQTSGGYRC